MAQRFDDNRLELIGEPIPLAEHVGYYLNYGFFSASTNGILIYRSETSQLGQLTWYDRQGRVLGTVGESGLYQGLALSPDGTQAAVGLQTSAQSSLLADVRLLDFVRGTKTRLTFGQGLNISPTWSPDGSHIIFASTRETRDADLYQKPASGAKNEELLLESSESKYPTSWSSDGRFLLYTAINPKTGRDLWVLPLEGDHKPIPFMITDFGETDGRFSPDMRWIAYVSDESGSDEIYVRGFSATSARPSSEGEGRWLISKGGGTGPRWRRDGKELFYRAPNGNMMVVEIMADHGFRAATPKPLFQAPPDLTTLSTFYSHSTWDVSPDGNRFLLASPSIESSSSFNVVLNWTALLKK